jgi:hypothetical protein
VPRTARQSGGLQQTKHYGDKKATCKKSYQSMSVRRQRFNIESLRHKKVVTRENEDKKVSVRGTLYRPRFRAVNIFGFAVVLRDVFIHRDITKIGRDWSFRTGVSILNASERGVSTEQIASAKENVGLIRRNELTAVNARIFKMVRHRRGVRL